MAGERCEVCEALTNGVGGVREGTSSKQGLLAKPQGLNFYKHYRSSWECPVRSVLRSRPNVAETGLDAAEGDEGGGGDDDVGGGETHGADAKSNAR